MIKEDWVFVALIIIIIAAMIKTINRKDAMTVIDPVSNIQNILRKVRGFQKVEIERV